jgi:hypothetical protein
MFECNKCENEESDICNYCVEVCCKPSEWKRKREDIEEIMKKSGSIDNDKC